MQRLDLDPKVDFSFLTNEDENEYCREAMALAKKNKAEKLSQVFSKTDSELLNILSEMLQFNPHLRPTSDQLLKREFFDEIRVPCNEKKAPHKI